MPGLSSICGKTKGHPIDCARSSLPGGNLSGKKIPLKQSKISSIFNYLSVPEGKMITMTMILFQNRDVLLNQAHYLMIVISSKKVLVNQRHQT